MINDIMNSNAENKLISYVLYPIYQFFTISLFVIIFIAQTLGILNLYHKPVVLILTPVLIGLLFYRWRKFSTSNFIACLLEKEKTFRPDYLNLAGYLTGFLLLILIIVPILNWPTNTLVTGLEWDAAEYHFPKAVELYSTGSAWDFSISYGDYPFGYESLLSFDLMLTNNEMLFPVTHVFITLFFILSAWLLSIRYSRLPKGILFLILNFLLLSGFFDRFNPWFFLRYVIYTVGKNDLFLGAATIGVIFFSSIGYNQDEKKDWFGLGLTSAIALSVKPNSGLIIIFIWLITILNELKLKQSFPSFLRKLIFPIFLSATGLIWGIRNIIGLGHLFNPTSYRITAWSIIQNITSINALLHLPNELKFSLLVLVFSVIISLIQYKTQTWKKTLLFIILLISFMITPASSDPNNPTLIAWRFGITLLIFQYSLIINHLDPVLQKIYLFLTKRKTFLALSLVIVIIIPTLFFGWQKDLLRKVPEKSALLERPYQVDNAPYPSVFDYIHENIHDSIIWVEGGYTYYAYGDTYSNSVTRNKKAQILVVLNDENETQIFTRDGWTPIYWDRMGIIFERE